MQNNELIRRRPKRFSRPVRHEDPTGAWTIRDWADLPVHHPREAAGAL